MITKAEVQEILRETNQLRVRIPIFESAGITKQAIIDANICYTPGNVELYAVGDIVYVGFENNNINNPVILGKLYQGKENEASTFSYSNSLEVTNKTILSSDTTIGDLGYTELSTLKNSRGNLQQQIDTINETLKKNGIDQL